jgi:hypothetical protein
MTVVTEGRPGDATLVRPWWTRIPLGILAVSGWNVGLWIQLAPQSFFDDFPGAGHHWVAAFGPYNEHLLRDFGAMNIALAVIATVALVRNQRTLVRVAAGAWFVFGIQHLGYHLFHVDMLEGADRVASPGALGFVIAAAWVAWWLAPAADG